MNPDGFYIAYFTAELGNSIGIFVVKNEAIIGADLGGGIYDGTFHVENDTASGVVTFTSRTGGVAITGAESDLPVAYDVNFSFSLPLEGAGFHSLETLAGPINVKFEKVREL